MPTSRTSHPPHPGPVLALLVAALSAAPVSAQREIRAPIGVQRNLVPDSAPADDPGRPPRLLESADVDRFLRRAQEALGREDHHAAIRILQDVIEGRTLTEVGAVAEPAPHAAAGEPAAEAPAPQTGPGPEHAVFSTDGRVYRPVRRLCQELLAAMPPAAITYYRSLFEVPAEQALASAAARQDVAATEQVFENWFVTRSAARAMQLAGDLRMDAGSYRAAIRDYALLLEVYPRESRDAIGIEAAWLRFKIALCLKLVGDVRGARAELEALADAAPGVTLRIGGELLAVEQLAETPWFADAGMDSPLRATPEVPGVTVLRSPRETVTPLWEQRFVDSDPYRPARGESEQRLVVGVQGSDQGPVATPRPAQFAPGATAWIEGDRIAFLDHFRIRLCDIPSGRALAATAGPTDQPTPRPGVPRVRIAAYDTVAQRVVADAERFYAVIGPGRRQLAGLKSVLSNHLEAFARDDLSPQWSTEGRDDFADVTFLAAPTLAGDRLLAPTGRAGTWGLDCLEVQSGALLFRVPLSTEGTDLARPIAPPVVVDAGIAYLLTGAGTLGAVDVHTGSLRWIRRYERVHPLRPGLKVRPKRGKEGLFGVTMFQETDIPGFAPSDLVVHDGLVVLAPCDSDVLLCLDGATGEPVWMLTRGNMQYLIGTAGDRLLVGAPDGVYCVGLRSGVRLWRRDLPSHHRSMEWRGRGVVGNGVLALPGDGAIHVLALDGDPTWTTLEMPGFGLGREPLDGRFNLQLCGPWMAAVHDGGVQVFSTVETMHWLADQRSDPFERARLLAQLGDLLGAVGALEVIDLEARPDLRDQVELRLLTWCSELALAMASHGEREAALAMLERCRGALMRPELRDRWHLERIEVFRTLGDLDAIAREQDALISRPTKE